MGVPAPYFTFYSVFSPVPRTYGDVVSNNTGSERSLAQLLPTGNTLATALLRTDRTAACSESDSGVYVQYTFLTQSSLLPVYLHRLLLCICSYRPHRASALPCLAASVGDSLAYDERRMVPEAFK